MSNEIYVYDVIGWGDATPLALRNAMAQADQSKPLEVRINSEGGSAFDGFAMFNALKTHAAGVNVFVDGIAASAASIIAMAGTKITMGPMSYLMIHEAWCGLMGNKREARKMADLLENIDTLSTQQYSKRTGNTDEQVKAWLESETWFNATEALAAKMADAIAGEQQQKAVAFVEADPKNESGNRWGYKNCPKNLLVSPDIALKYRGKKDDVTSPEVSHAAAKMRIERMKLGAA